MEIKMAVFDGRHLDVRVLVNHPRANIMTKEHLRYRHGATSVSNSDLSTNGVILHGGLDQLCCPGRAVDIDGLGTLSAPRNRQQRTKARRVIVMMMSDKNRSNFSEIYTSLRKTTGNTVAGINEIMCPIDSEEIG